MSIPFYNDLDIKNNKILNVGTPTNNDEAANKGYIDIAIDNLHTEVSAEVTNEVATLNNRIDGVNDRITNLENGLSNTIETVAQPLIETNIFNNIVDDLSSTDATKSLSANQGRLLDTRIDAVRDLIIENKYEEIPVLIGNYLNIPLYRVIILGTIDTVPNINDVIRLAVSDVVEPGESYIYEVVNMYGNFTTNYDVLHESIDIPKTYKMFEVDCLSVTNLTKPYIYLGNVDITNNEIHTWFKFGSDFQALFNDHTELLPINYRVVIEFTRQTVITPNE